MLKRHEGRQRLNTILWFCPSCSLITPQLLVVPPPPSSSSSWQLHHDLFVNNLGIFIVIYKLFPILRSPPRNTHPFTIPTLFVVCVGPTLQTSLNLQHTSPSFPQMIGRPPPSSYSLKPQIPHHPPLCLLPALGCTPLNIVTKCIEYYPWINEQRWFR